MPEPWLRSTARPADSPNAITSPCSADAPGHAQAWHCQHLHGLACKPEPPGPCKVRAQALTVAASAGWIIPASLKCIRAGGPVVFITTEPSCPVKCSGCTLPAGSDRADSADPAGAKLRLTAECACMACSCSHSLSGPDWHLCPASSDLQAALQRRA